MLIRRGLLLAAPAVVKENRKAGATGWQLTNIKANAENGKRSTSIEGQSLEICVSTGFTVEIFHMGYYGRHGGRLYQTLTFFWDSRLEASRSSMIRRRN